MQPDFSAQLELSVSADRKNIREVVQRIHEIGQRTGFLQNLRTWDAIRLRLATDEALQNAIEHGCHGNTEMEIHVNIDASTHRMQIGISDPGSGFLHTAQIEILPLEARGRGIVLMRFAANQVEFNPLGNQVTLTFVRSANS